jgi:hypothetical protein
MELIGEMGLKNGSRILFSGMSTPLHDREKQQVKMENDRWSLVSVH